MPPDSGATSLLEAFGGAVEAFRDRVAVRDGSRCLSYQEVDVQSNGIARRLRSLGVGQGDLVGLCVERGWRVVVGMLAILKTGAAYLPLDPAYPPDRLQFMCEDSGARLVLCDDPRSVPPPAEPVGWPQTTRGAPDATSVGVAVSRDDLAYVIYTSGSTGRPKGVLVAHGNVLSLLSGAASLFDFSADDRWSLFTSPSFDVSVWEMWMALTTGASVVAVPSEVARSPHAFVELLARERVTVLNQVPSVFRHVAAAYLRAAAPQLALRYVIFAGEALDRQAIRSFLQAGLHNLPTWVNMYGTTETTVHATFKALAGDDLERDGSTPIGRSLPHLRLLLLDDERRPAADGTAGELWLAGPGVTHGYLNRPDVTSERFVTLDIDGTPMRCYRSGDLACKRADGEYEYIGRADSQIKLRGFRIEPGEIEAALRGHPLIRDAAVVKLDTKRDAVLVAVVVPGTTGGTPGTQELRNYLAQRLPVHMLPNRVLTANELPLSPTGKLDRSAVVAIATTGEGRHPELAD